MRTFDSSIVLIFLIQRLFVWATAPSKYPFYAVFKNLGLLHIIWRNSADRCVARRWNLRSWGLGTYHQQAKYEIPWRAGFFCAFIYTKAVLAKDCFYIKTTYHYQIKKCTENALSCMVDTYNVRDCIPPNCINGKINGFANLIGW